jgi:mRNA interferase RelE/StbE
MDFRVTIQWTETSKKLLLKLPKKDARGIYQKIDSLRQSDPRKAGKALIGPFRGLRRLTYGRYRAIFVAEEEKLASGVTLLRAKVTVVAVGIRKERDKHDVYRVAKKLIELGLLKLQDAEEEAD